MNGSPHLPIDIGLNGAASGSTAARRRQTPTLLNARYISTNNYQEDQFRLCHNCIAIYLASDGCLISVGKANCFAPNSKTTAPANNLKANAKMWLHPHGDKAPIRISSYPVTQSTNVDIVKCFFRHFWRLPTPGSCFRTCHTCPTFQHLLP